MNSLEINEEVKEFVRKELNLTEDDIKRDVEILKEWMKKQLHLPQGVQDDSFFENAVVRNKGRVERAKQRIDSYYTVKTIWPEIYQNFQEVHPSKVSLEIFPIFQLTKDRERIIFVRIYKNSGETFDFLEAVRLFFVQLEIFNKYDYFAGIHLLIDATDIQMDLFKCINPDLQRKSYSAMSEVFSYRLRGIHYYKPPAWIGLLMNMAKQILKRKIFDRIYIHKDLDALLKHIPLKSLPSDYGGEQPSVLELRAQSEKLIADHKEYLEEVANLKSNEKLRVGKSCFDSEMFGVDGTFKKLNID